METVTDISRFERGECVKCPFSNCRSWVPKNLEEFERHMRLAHNCLIAFKHPNLYIRYPCPPFTWPIATEIDMLHFPKKE